MDFVGEYRTIAFIVLITFTPSVMGVAHDSSPYTPGAFGLCFIGSPYRTLKQILNPVLLTIPPKACITVLVQFTHYHTPWR